MLTYALSIVGCTTPLVNCTSDAASVPVEQGFTQNATVHFNAQNTIGTGTVILRATHTASGTSNDGTINVNVIVLSSVSNGALTLDNRFLLQGTANSYDATGRITQLTDARGKGTNYLYDGNLCKASVTKITRVHDATGSVDLVTNIGCDTQGNVASIQDEGGSFRYFTYDTYGRLRQMKNNGQTVAKAYGYTYSRTSANSWTFQAASPNAVVDSTFSQQTPSVKVVVSTGYIDGLGRPIESVVQDGTNYVVTATQYDLMGRTWRTWKPYTRTTAGYDASFATSATTFYNTYHGTSTAQPYVETLYRPDALNRVSKVIPEYIGTTPTAFTLTSYGIDATPTVQQQIVEVTDEAGKKKRAYADVFGNTVKTILGYGAAEATTTTFRSE